MANNESFTIKMPSNDLKELMAMLFQLKKMYIIENLGFDGVKRVYFLEQNQILKNNLHIISFCLLFHSL